MIFTVSEGYPVHNSRAMGHAARSIITVDDCELALRMRSARTNNLVARRRSYSEKEVLCASRTGAKGRDG